MGRFYRQSSLESITSVGPASPGGPWPSMQWAGLPLTSIFWTSDTMWRRVPGSEAICTDRNRAKKSSLVSVVMPAFNAREYVDVALASVLSQTYRELDVIVVDDGSDDGTPDLVRRIAAGDSRVRLDVLPVNSGRPAVARNRGVALAHGDFVAFIDADDAWTPFRLADQMVVMEHMPDLVLVYSMFKSFGVHNPLAIEFGIKPLPHKAATTRHTLERENTIPCSSVLARRDVLIRAGLFDEDHGLAAVEDYDLWLRMSEYGHIGFIPRLHGFYRVHSSSISRSGDIQERVSYLYGKRGIHRSLRSRASRSAISMATRALGHLSAEAWVRAEEMWGRRNGRRVHVKVS